LTLKYELICRVWHNLFPKIIFTCIVFYFLKGAGMSTRSISYLSQTFKPNEMNDYLGDELEDDPPYMQEIDNSQPSSPSLAWRLCENIPSVVVSTCMGSFGGWVFNIISPLGGAIFGATAVISSIIIEHHAEKKWGDCNICVKGVIKIVSWFLGFGIAALVTNIFGIAISLSAAVNLTAAMLTTSFAVQIIASNILFFSMCLCSTALHLLCRFV
jgi:hypothetical protein